MRSRDTTERGYRHQTPVSFSKKEEKWQRERRHTDKRGEPRSSCRCNSNTHSHTYAKKNER